VANVHENNEEDSDEMVHYTAIKPWPGITSDVYSPCVQGGHCNYRECEVWAAEGQCHRIPEFMFRECTSACVKGARLPPSARYIKLGQVSDLKEEQYEEEASSVEVTASAEELTSVELGEANFEKEEEEEAEEEEEKEKEEAEEGRRDYPRGGLNAK